MKALLARFGLRSWLKDPANQRKLAFAGVVVGLHSLRVLLECHEGELEDHEDRLKVVERVQELHYDVDELERARAHATGREYHPPGEISPDGRSVWTDGHWCPLAGAGDPESATSSAQDAPEAPEAPTLAPTGPEATGDDGGA